MSDFNSQKNRLVWFDIPVADLERASKFYGAVLAIAVHAEQYGDYRFAVLEHADGNGGCLVPKPEDISSDKGILVYLNVDGRMQHAVEQVTIHGGKVLEPIHAIGPHGFRAVILDSEGNRLALHANSEN